MHDRMMTYPAFIQAAQFTKWIRTIEGFFISALKEKYVLSSAESSGAG